jgi:hypothetical protein
MRCSPFAAALLLFTAPAFAKSEFPARLDSACRSQGRTPSNPAELARATGVPYGDCALCHDIDPARGRYPTGGNDNADGAAYKRGDLDPFCTLAVANQSPVLAPIGSVGVAVGQPVALLLSASDADGDALAFSATGLPSGAVFLDGGNGMAAFDWTPAQAGNTAITFSVTDGAASDSERVVVTVGGVNAAPVLAPIGDQTVPVGETLSLAIQASDPEGGALVFDAAGLPTGADFQDFGGGNAELSFAPSAAGAATVGITVTDAGTPPESASETFLLTAVDPSPGSGPTLEWAAWDVMDGELLGRGSGAPPGSLLTIVDAASEGALAVVRAGPTGRFTFEARTFLAPCTVRARGSDGALGIQSGVLNAPLDCGTALLTHAKPHWRCKGGLLSVRGGRGPVAGDLTVLDATTGATLMEAQTDRRGRFRIGVSQARSPANVRLRFASGVGEWLLGPLAVGGSELACDPTSGGGGKGGGGKGDDDDGEDEDEDGDDGEEDEDEDD